MIYDKLINDQYVMALWKSPSRNGYKGLIRLQYEEPYGDISMHDKHRVAFCAIYEYMLSMYGIEFDKSGFDPTRLCFYELQF